jgi:putative ABC transport system substrate-binding protein
MSPTRRRALIVAAGTLLIAPLSSVAQQSPRVRRIGVITTRARPLALETDYLGAWIPRLRELGYLEGRDFSVEWRFADGNNERLPELASELVRLQPDLILAAGTPAARAMQKATSTIPIVIAGVADPVGFGLVASLSRPGGNITGTAIMATDVSVKSLEYLLAFVPDLNEVAVLLNPTNPIDSVALRQIQASAAPLGVHIVAFEASNPGQIDAAFGAIAKSRIGALILAPDPFLVNQARQVVELATRSRLPAIYPFRPFVEAGGLMCYGQNIYENFRVAANYMDRIFKGGRPGDLPVEQPMQLEFVLNRKAAETIGLKIPQAIRLRADKVID